jgi:hypothetical protein
MPKKEVFYLPLQQALKTLFKALQQVFLLKLKKTFIILVKTRSNTTPALYV